MTSKNLDENEENKRFSIDKYELQKMFIESEKNLSIQNDKTYEKLNEIHIDIKRLIEMLEPVHSHAEWVDGLRARLHSIGLMRNTSRIE
jgi:hypothetical protein